MNNAIIGAGIAIVAAVIGAIAQHVLSLRADRIKKERDRQEREAKDRMFADWMIRRDRGPIFVRRW